MRGVNGKLLIAQCKYGDKQNLFESYDKALGLIEQYPILFSILPDDMKDKKMVLTFIKANGKCVARYQEILSLIREEDAKLAEQKIFSAPRGLHAPYFEEETELRNNAYVDTMFDLGEFTKDAEILTEAMNVALKGTWFVDSVGGFILNPGNYDEKTLCKVVKSVPEIVCRIYEYWNEYVDGFPKVKESVMVKYGLRNNPSSEELAFFKSLSMVDENNQEVLNHLFQCFTIGSDGQINEEHKSEIRSIFMRFSPEIQNSLIAGNYRYVEYAKKGVLDENLQSDIINRCPIAGDILPDTAVLKYNLSQSESDEAAFERCDKCRKCAFYYAVMI